jgi:hypothetical protein
MKLEVYKIFLEPIFYTFLTQFFYSAITDNEYFPQLLSTQHFQTISITILVQNNKHKHHHV